MQERAWERIGEGAWLKRFPLNLLGTRIGRLVTVFQLDGGDVLVHSTGPFQEDDRRFLQRLGTRIHALESTCFHDTFTRRALRALPEASFYVPENFPIKEAGFKAIGDLEPILGGALEMIPIGGMPKVNEVAVHDRENRLLVVSDLLFNFGPETDAWTKLFFRVASGIKVYPGMSRMFRAMIRDRSAFKSSVDRLRSLAFDKLVVAHGEPILGGAREALDQALERHGF